MHRFLLTAGIALSAAAVYAGGVSAQGFEPQPTYAAPAQSAGSPDLIFTLRGGVATSPEYFGSDEYQVGPDLGFQLNYAAIGPLNFGRTDGVETYGLGLRGSFRYIGERDSDDFDELRGLDDVDATAELGLGVGYTSERFDAFADLRYGIGGHESFVGELGADVKLHPSERLTLKAGPRMLLGSDDYASTYFGVSPDEALASNGLYDAYDADGGVVSAGVEVGARYDLNGPWGIEGAVTYDRLVGDASDSPIVEQGDRDQYGLRIGITRQITLDF